MLWPAQHKCHKIRIGGCLPGVKSSIAGNHLKAEDSSKIASPQTPDHFTVFSDIQIDVNGLSGKLYRKDWLSSNWVCFVKAGECWAFFP